MKDIIGWLVIGTILVYLGISGIVEPLDQRVTSLVGPYLMVPLGLILFLRGAWVLVSIKTINPYKRFAILTAYPFMTLGIALIFARWLIDAVWLRILIGLVVFGIGLLLMISLQWGKQS